jgi:hypothetical protein
VTIPARQQIGLLASGSSLYVVTPRGYVARLDPKTLAARKVAPDGARPRALAVTRGRLLIASPGGVTALSQGSFAPVPAATALPGARLLAGGDGAPVLAVGTARACLVDPAVVACATPEPKFAVTGAGVVRADSGVVLANGAAGTLVRYVRKGDRLVPAETLSAGPGVHGNLLTFRDRLYAPVTRGIAVVDPAGKARTTVIRLPTSPLGSGSPDWPAVRLPGERRGRALISRPLAPHRD